MNKKLPGTFEAWCLRLWGWLGIVGSIAAAFIWYAATSSWPVRGLGIGVGLVGRNWEFHNTSCICEYYRLHKR